MGSRNQAQAPNPESDRKPYRTKAKRIILICVLAVLLIVMIGLLVCFAADRRNADRPQDSTPTATSAPSEASPAEDQIVCDDYGSYSGQYVEDGRDEAVQNVLAVRVTNRSDRFLDFATLAVNFGGKTATFIVTGLPAGRSAWVLEASRMTVSEGASFTVVDCVSSFRDGIVAETDEVKISSDGNTLTATNNTSQTLENVCVYYRNLHTDGSFLGGITYLVDFGTLEPGKSAEVPAGHYKEEISEIVRIDRQVQ